MATFTLVFSTGALDLIRQLAGPEPVFLLVEDTATILLDAEAKNLSLNIFIAFASDSPSAPSGSVSVVLITPQRTLSTASFIILKTSGALLFVYPDPQVSSSLVILSPPVTPAPNQIALFHPPGGCDLIDPKIVFQTPPLPDQPFDLRFDADGLAFFVPPLLSVGFFVRDQNTSTSQSRRVDVNSGYILECATSGGQRALNLTPSIPVPFARRISGAVNVTVIRRRQRCKTPGRTRKDSTSIIDPWRTRGDPRDARF